MIVTVGDASPRQARGHIGDGCVKWEHFLNDGADVADQTGTVRGRIERVEMSLKRGFHMIITVIVSICRRLIGDTSPKRRRLLRSYGNQALATRTAATKTATQMYPLFPNFSLKRLLVFRANSLPLRVCEIVLFNCTTWKSYF